MDERSLEPQLQIMFPGNTAKQHLYMFVAIFANMALQVYFKRCLVCLSQQSLFNTLSCIYFLLFLAVDHMHASFALSLSFWLFCHWGICLLLAIGGAFASSELNGLLGVGSGTTPSCTAS